MLIEPFPRWETAFFFLAAATQEWGAVPAFILLFAAPP
ncbi:hypothetical protein D1AOALGA4SA_2082 [Olavius algarvensis Delta 1 endosymbiont]|nr:hypothetical protein D1AOALGA4SA_2082 [Olavius algarvensis Delta 1 endosymbiont]